MNHQARALPAIAELDLILVAAVRRAASGPTCNWLRRLLREGEQAAGTVKREVREDAKPDKEG